MSSAVSPVCTCLLIWEFTHFLQKTLGHGSENRIKLCLVGVLFFELRFAFTFILPFCLLPSGNLISLKLSVAYTDNNTHILKEPFLISFITLKHKYIVCELNTVRSYT